MIRIKRIYGEASPGDGLRIYVDRLWPRGLKKDAAKIDRWMKELAPSDELRKWFAHDRAKFEAFKKRYILELQPKADLLESIRKEGKRKRITLPYSARDTEHNNAAVLKEILTRKEKKK